MLRLLRAGIGELDEDLLGLARASFEDGAYSLLATFGNLPEPSGSDFYEGWVLKNQILELEDDTYQKIVDNNSHISNELVTFIANAKGDLQTLTLGVISNLANF